MVVFLPTWTTDGMHYTHYQVTNIKTIAQK